MSDRLAFELAKHIALGSITPEEGLPVLRELVGESTRSLQELSEALGKLDLAHGPALRGAINRQQCREAREASSPPEGISPDMPRAWQPLEELRFTAQALIQAVRQRAFLEAGSADDKAAVAARVESLSKRLHASANPWSQLGAGLELFDPALADAWATRLTFEKREAKAGRVPAGVHDEETLLATLVEAYQATAVKRLQARILDQLLRWPTSLAAPAIARVCQMSPWAQDRACLVLSYRLQSADFETWASASKALSRPEYALTRVQRRSPFAKVGPELSLIWLNQWKGADPKLVSKLQDAVGRRAQEAGEEELFPKLTPFELSSAGEAKVHPLIAAQQKMASGPKRGVPVARLITPASKTPAKKTPRGVPVARLIVSRPKQPVGKDADSVATGLLVSKRRREAAADAVHPLAKLERERARARAKERRRAPAPETPKHARPPRRPATPPPPPVPAKPSVWDEHLRPLLVENWYMVVGLAMVMVGASLLAYFTWDKNLLLRFTVMPALLLVFTLALGEAGFRMGRAKEELRGTALLLTGAAVVLIPLNFLVVLLALDAEKFPPGMVVAGILGVVYVGAFSWALRRWGSGVREGFGGKFAVPFILLNVLATALPIAAQVAPKHQAVVLAIGAYLCFAVLVWAVRAFCRNVLTPELLAERLTYFFVGGALVLTFLEGLLWSHVAAETWPLGSAYSLLIVLAGGLVLYVERAFLALQTTEDDHRAESFLGFALILLGLLIAMASPPLRVVSFAVAGAIWLSQARRRAGLQHQAIGVILLLMGGCSIALYEWFPGVGLPLLGLGMAGGLRALDYAAGRLGNAPLATTASKFGPFVLAATAVVAVLSQWHFRFEPLVAAITIAFVAGAFLARAVRQDRIDLAHAGMALCALALPYLGCADMTGRALRGNSMVFGLGLLSFAWLGAIHLIKKPVLVRARSSVLCLLGALACSAMALRVLVEGSGAADASNLRIALDLSGPLLMAGALVVATYTSRSLVPALIGAVIMAVLFPELKAQTEALFPWIHWGSGRTASICSLALVALCFVLQRIDALSDLQGGDRILDRFDFPLIRRDSSLFTLPLGVTVAFLATKGLLWDSPRNWTRLGLPAKTAVALLIHSLNWVGLTVLLRRHPLSKVTVHLGMVSLTAGILFGFTGLEAPQLELPAVVWLVTLSVATLLLEGLGRRVFWTREVLLIPIRRMARFGTLALGLGAAFAFCLGVAEPNLLSGLVLLACLWHGLETRELRYGMVAFVLTVPWLFSLGFHTPGLEREAALAAGWRNLVLLALGVQSGMLAIEFRRPLYLRLRGLLAPFHHGTSALALLLGAQLGLALFIGFAPEYALVWQGGLLAVLAFVARGQRSGVVAFLACCVGYMIAHGSTLAPLATEESFQLLLTPSHLTLWTLGIAAISFGLRPGYVARPARFRGSFSLLGAELFPLAELYVPTLLASLLAVLLLTIVWLNASGGWLLPKLELVAPYLAAATVAFMSANFLRRPMQGLAIALLAVANTHLINQLVITEYLMDAGIAPTHVVCLGLILTLLQGSVARRIVRREGFDRVVFVANIVLAGAVLALLAIHYISHPNLQAITWPRFVVSGLVAVGAGLYFRQAARNPRPPFESWSYQLEGFYHFGLSMGLWCLFLLVPQLRYPGTALIALGTAPLYFYLRAEYSARVEGGALGPIGERYRDSAIVLSFFLMGLYATQGLFQLIMFPALPLNTAAYQVGAPVLLVVSFGLMRLRGLGGTDWLTFYGALGLVVGTFFSLSAIPGLSPFEHTVAAAAWLALGVSHFFALATSQPSPLRTGIQWISGLDDMGWTSQRTAVGAVTLVATCAMVVLGIAFSDSPLRVAPLLLGLATIFAHHAWITGFLWQRTVTVLIVVVAIHTDFVLESYLAREVVRWVLLAGWFGVILAYGRLRRHESESRLADVLALFALLAGCHVLYFHPESRGSLLLALGFMGLCLASPSERLAATEARDKIGASLLLLGIPWLGYFAVSDLRGGAAPWAVWPLFSVAACVVGQGWVLHRYSAEWAKRLAAREPAQPRMLHLVIDLWSRLREEIFLGSLVAGTLLAAVATVQQVGAVLPPEALMVACTLWAALAVLWYQRGREHESLGLILLAEACAVLLLWLIRQQLRLGTDYWTLEHDVWASIALTAILAGAREVVGESLRQTRRALIGTLLALPILAIAWALFNGLSSDVTLVVVGVNALIFTFMGRGSRNSPFNLAGVAGFVAFVLLVFYTKLEVRSVQAYVIPTGIGVLVLLQLFGKDLTTQARNRVQGVTLLAMVASSAYYAVFDASHPIAFNVTLIGVGLAAMLAGTVLRIRLYLVLGGLGILLDLVSIAWKVVMGMGRTVQVTTLGALLLLAGVALVAGSAYYKSNKDHFDANLARLRARFADWT